MLTIHTPAQDIELTPTPEGYSGRWADAHADVQVRRLDRVDRWMVFIVSSAGPVGMGSHTGLDEAFAAAQNDYFSSWTGEDDEDLTR